MWTRRMSTNLNMDQADFVAGFLLALDNDKVIKKLHGGMFIELKNEISHLKDIFMQKDSKIAVLEKELADMRDTTDALEQYSRRNSLRVTGLKEIQYEDPVQVALSFCNSRLHVRPEITINDIDRVHRVGPRDGERKLLIKFATYRARQRVYACRTALKSPRQQRPPDDPWRMQRDARISEPTPANDDVSRMSTNNDDAGAPAGDGNVTPDAARAIPTPEGTAVDTTGGSGIHSSCKINQIWIKLNL